MEFGLKGKVAVITGSSGGIGNAIARALANEGCKVCINGRNRQTLTDAVNKMKSDGIEVYGDVIDVTNSASIQEYILKITDELGGIDIWVNNAGICLFSTITDMEEDEWDKLINVNMKSVFLCTKYVSRVMKKKKKGVIINAASFAALIPSANSGGYAVTKSAVLSMTKTLAAELAPWNIRVNAYIPGVINTNMTQNAIEQNTNEMLKPIALQRFERYKNNLKFQFQSLKGTSHYVAFYLKMS
ncbi:MAG TPA: SDR family NAD(P)-dependent oxidoreductase [Ruminiclostridium sp.]